MDLIYRYDPFQPIVINRPNSTEEAVKSLLAGNRRLLSLVHKMQQATLGEEPDGEHVVPVNPVSLGLPFWPGAVIEQKPFALILGCSDARVPLESVFDVSFNGLFVVRVAGNVLGTEGLGSFNYAVRHLGGGLQAVIVLGHSGCGAVTAAVDSYLSPGDYTEIAYTYALRSLLDRVMIAARGAAHALERCCGQDIHKHPQYRTALIAVAVYLNAAINSAELQREIATNSDAPPAVFYGGCDLQTMLVTSQPVWSLDTAPDLQPAPKSGDELTAVAYRLAESVVAGGLLK